MQEGEKLNRYRKETTILSLSDLLRYYVRHCISIVLAGVLCAVLVSGYLVIRSRKTDTISLAQAETETLTERDMLFDLNEKKQQQLNIDNYLMEKSALQNTFNSLQEQIRKYNEYLTNSVLMNLDPYHVVNSSVDMRVWILEEGKIQHINTLLLYYRQLLNNGKYLSDLADELCMDQTYLKELLTVSIDYPIYLDDLLQGGLPADNEGLLAAHLTESAYGFLYITVKGMDPEWTEKVLERVESYLYSLAEENPLGIMQKLEEIDRYTITGLDADVRTAQVNSNQYNITLYNQLNTINTTINNLKAPGDVVSESSSSLSRRSLLKYMIFGGAVGVLLMLLFYSLKYLFDDSVSSFERIALNFNINHLGSFKASANTHRLAETATIEMICANVRIYSDAKDKILLVGCANEALLNGIGKILSEHLSDQSIIIGGNIAKDPGAREKLSDCDAVVLLEERKVSKHSIIQNELEILDPLDVKLLGIVVA